MHASVLVIGLGRFGAAAARELELLGHEVLAVDRSETLVNDIAPQVTHAVQLDASDDAALRSIGAGEFAFAIVGISGNIEASIFATMALKQLGVRHIIAKAANGLHGTILERVGADRVVYPEREMGQRVAHSLGIEGVVDYLDVAADFGIVKVTAPASYVGRSFKELDLSSRLQVSPIALRRGSDVTVNPHRDTVIGEGDELIIMGRDGQLEGIGKG